LQARHVLWGIAVGLPFALAIGVLAAGGTSGVSKPRDSATWKSIDPRAFTSAGCRHGAAITAGYFELGAKFRGLAASREIAECLRARSRIAVSGPLRQVGYVYQTYGTCNYRLQPCYDPLEVQTWPECARDPNSYTPERGMSRGKEPTLNPRQLVKIKTAPELPAASYNEGTRIELYGGGSTVVVFTHDPALARRAAQALAPGLLRHASPTSAARLDSEADAPGNALACHHLLAAGGQR
jgi:hypothetical protein